MKKYEKPFLECQIIIKEEIASGLENFLEDNSIYQPGITSFYYNS